MSCPVWSESEVVIMFENYGKIHIRELCKLLPNRGIEAIRTRAKILKIKANRKITNRKNEVNHNFFSNINAITCYYAGLIAADGNIRSNNDTLTLNQKDRTVIDKFVEYIQYSGVVTKRINSTKEGNYCHSVAITSTQIVTDLNDKFNIVPRKSLILKPPIGLDYFHSLCFIVGYLDGDGYISLYKKQGKKPYMVLGILGTEEICQWIKNILEIGNISIRKDCKNIIYKYTATCNKAIAVINILRSVKELEGVRFTRKLDKILELNK